MLSPASSQQIPQCPAELALPLGLRPELTKGVCTHSGCLRVSEKNAPLQEDAQAGQGPGGTAFPLAPSKLHHPPPHAQGLQRKAQGWGPLQHGKCAWEIMSSQ